MHQQKYMNEQLDNFEMTGYNTITKPYETNEMLDECYYVWEP